MESLGGRVNLYLLDTGLEENAPQDRDLSARLYGGDRETRLQQEIILGIGGVRALRALGISPAVWHLNEGHAAFVVLQRIYELNAQGLPTSTRRSRRFAAATIFTTHTPVARVTMRSPSTGSSIISRAPGGRWRITATGFLALGEHSGQFNMTALALRTSDFANGVSRLHGE